MEQREILQTGKTREAGFSDRNFVSILYLENRITNQSKVSKFANNDIKTSEAGTYENKIQKTKNDQSSATLGVKRLKASEVKAVIHRPLVYFISFASQMIRQRFA